MKAQTRISPITVTFLSADEFWSDVEKLMNQVRQRAYQLFECRSCADGHDVEDWLNAEMEILKPVPLEITEKDKVLHIRADVLGFKKEELKINLEPGVFTIRGEHQKETAKKDKNKSRSEQRTIQQLFQRVTLPASVVPDKATATLKGGVLEVFAPKAEAGEKKMGVKAA